MRVRLKRYMRARVSAIRISEPRTKSVATNEAIPDNDTERRRSQNVEVFQRCGRLRNRVRLNPWTTG